MQKSIIFGANGYIGSHLAYLLSERKEFFTPLDISDQSIGNYSNYKSINIVNKEEFEQLDFNVDYIYVFAGLSGTNVGFDKYSEFIKVNEIGLLNILDHHKNTKSRARIIFPSSRLVYKGKTNTPIAEDGEKEPKTIYAQTKLASEEFLKMYQNYFGIDYTIFRICVPFGNLFGNDYSYGTIGFFLSKAKNGENITLYGDGHNHRTFTHVHDVCDKIFVALQNGNSKNEIFNIGGENRSLKEVAVDIAEYYNVGIDYCEWPENALKLESGDTIFNADKLHTITGDNYNYTIKQWLD